MNCHVFVMRPSRDRKSAHLLHFPLSVMPGLVPGISIGAIAATGMDARNKSGHDDIRTGMTGGGPRRRARALRPASPPVGGEGWLRSCVPPPSRQRAGRGVPVLRAFRVRARAGVGAGAVRAPDCARETAHAPLALAHAGGFFGPQPVAFCRNDERRPRKPPLSTFILHHTAKCQARTGTKNESAGDFSWMPVEPRPGPPPDRPLPSCPDLFRASPSTASAARPHGCPEQVRA